jgi:hypothetical protein
MMNLHLRTLSALVIAYGIPYPASLSMAMVLPLEEAD